MRGMSGLARVYILAVVAAGMAVAITGIGLWRCADPLRFFTYLVVALVGSGLKVALPGIKGTMSVNYVFILLGVLQLSLAETLAIGIAATVMQSWWHARDKPKPVQFLFNGASLSLSIGIAYWFYTAGPLVRAIGIPIIRLALASCAYFLANTLSIAGVISLTEKKPVRQIWRDCYFWSFPYYLLGASIAGGMSHLANLIGWHVSLTVLPFVYVIYRSYRLYLRQLEEEKNHAEAMAALHLRTIEALALAIEAKDHTTREHLRRVQVYAVELGKELGLSEPEIQALRAASILHDIGKLAVPDYIISKPGRLTPEEFEKMKIHPVVGAEILERVKFPYPVVPVVRCHHERWDGTGYPGGLKGEEIPIGARILAAVDCLDALASDRQYRRALPLDEAMEVVTAESERSFDPRVVSALQKRYRELEQLAWTRHALPARSISHDLKVERGKGPATGFEVSGTARADHPGSDFMASIAAARQEVQFLYEFTQHLGNSLSLEETLSVVAVRLKALVPHDAVAIYIRDGDRLLPKYVVGENSRLFAALEIPVGQGLSGWVAQNKKPIINGNPSVEPGYLDDPAKFSTLRSALAVPLEGLNNVIGVLALYHADKDAFTRDHLRILLAINSKVSLAIENALTYRQAQIKATTDALTDLPNATSLFLHLDAELSRCRRHGMKLAVLVCDLDGFKQVNDRYGHLEGNNVLRLVARGLRESCREYDYVGRMGGDEFVLILPSADRTRLDDKIDALGKVVADIGRKACGVDCLGISIGDAYYPEDGSDAETLMATADRRMYKVKRDHKAVRAMAAPASGLCAAPAIPEAANATLFL